MNFRILTLFGVGMAVVVPIIYLVSQGRFTMAGLVIAGVFFLTVFRRMDLWWMVAIATTASGLQTGIPRVSVSLAAALGFAALGILHTLMQHGDRQIRFSRPQKYALVLAVVAVVTAMVRGWGLRVLGSATWGGMMYINLLIGLGFYLFSARVYLTEKRLCYAVIGLCVLAMLPGFIRLAGSILPGVGSFGRLISGEEVEQIQQAAAPGGGRMIGMQGTGLWLVVAAVILYDLRYRLNPLIMGMALLGFYLIGISGYRGAMLQMGLTVAVYMYVRRKTAPPQQYYFAGMMLFLAIVVLYVTAPLLPVTIQRSIAVLPGINISTAAAIDAQGTTEWRLDLWRLLLPTIPQYLVVGKGLAFDLMDAYSVYTLHGDLGRLEFMIATHSYHSGPLTLLYDLGLGGFIAGFGVLFAGCVYYFRKMSLIPDRTARRSIYTVIYCYFVVSTVMFTIVFGDVMMLASIVRLAAIMEVIHRSVQYEKDVAAKESDVPPELIARWSAPPRGPFQRPVGPKGVLRPGFVR